MLTFAYKKSGTAGCCSALRGSGIALLFRTSNTEVHAEYAYARVYLKYTRQESHILRTSIAAMPWNKIEFTRFRKAKNKVRMTPFFIKCRKP